MRFYKQPLDQRPHRFYCGVDLHARCMYLCILDAGGQTVLHKDYPADAGAAFFPAAPPSCPGREVRRGKNAGWLIARRS